MGQWNRGPRTSRARMAGGTGTKSSTEGKLSRGKLGGVDLYVVRGNLTLDGDSRACPGPGRGLVGGIFANRQEVALTLHDDRPLPILCGVVHYRHHDP